MTRKHKILLDTRKHKNKPTNAQAGSISNRISSYPVEVDINELAEAIQKGYTTVLCELKSDKRKDDQFESSSLIYIDMDNSLSPDELLELCKDFPPALMYYSFSQEDFSKPNPSTHDKPGWRYRVIWQLKEPITSRSLYKAVLGGLITRYGGDGSCKDSARLVYGGRLGSMFHLNDVYVEPPTYEKKEKLINTQFKKPVDSINQLKQHQVATLMNGLRFKRKYLLSNREHRYTKLTNFCYWLMSLNFMSPDLAKYLVVEFISGDFDLTEQYVITWDKDYKDISELIIDWCEDKYA